MPVHGQVAHDGDSGRAHRHEDHRLPAVRIGVGIGDTEEDGDLAACRRRAARPPLVAVDDISVAVALDPAADVRRVAARVPRFGHREARADLAGEQRVKELLVLQRRPEAGQDLHVAGVGGAAVGGLGEQRDASHDLAQRRVLEVSQSGAVFALRQEQVPEFRGASFWFQLFDYRGWLPAIAFIDMDR